MAKKSSQRAKRKAEKNQTYNLKFKQQLRKILKSTSVNELKKAIPLIDKMAGRGVIHRNRAARLKSKLARATKKSESQPKKQKAKVRTKK